MKVEPGGGGGGGEADLARRKGGGVGCRTKSPPPKKTIRSVIDRCSWGLVSSGERRLEGKNLNEGGNDTRGRVRPGVCTKRSLKKKRNSEFGNRNQNVAAGGPGSRINDPIKKGGWGCGKKKPRGI